MKRNTKKIFAIVMTVVLAAFCSVAFAGAESIKQEVKLTLGTANANTNINFVIDKTFTVSAETDENGVVTALIPAFYELVINKGEAPTDKGNESVVEKADQPINQTIQLSLGTENANTMIYMEQDDVVNPDKLTLDENGNLVMDLGYSASIGFTTKDSVDQLTETEDAENASVLVGSEGESGEKDKDAATATDGEEAPAKKNIGTHIIFGVGLAVCVGYLIFDRVSKKKKNNTTGRGGDDDEI